MKLHPIMSAELVAKVSHFSDLVAAVRAHHETWDGRGYPDQLSGDSIPLAARVIAVADTIDAMTTSRPYRAGMTMAEVRDEILRERARQFDPRMADAITVQHSWGELAAVVERAQLDYPASQHNDSVAGLLVGNTGEFVLLPSR
jgi:HD-GYP domain-containing protein (c-di-GMP phosphodiesterase class II)